MSATLVSNQVFAKSSPPASSARTDAAGWQSSVAAAGGSGGADAILDQFSTQQHGQLDAWDGVTAGMQPADKAKTETELNRPRAAAEMIAQNWDKWGLHDGMDFNNPPANLPPEAKAVLKYVASNPALTNALDVGAAGGDKADGIITRNDVKHFASDTEREAKDAGSTLSDWLTKNGDAGGQSMALARSSAIMLANQRLTQNADPDQQPGMPGQRSADGLVTQNGLANIATSNPGLSPALAGAAKLFEQPGMFHSLDQAGDDVATSQPDGKASYDNIKNFLTKDAPTSDAAFADTMNQAALRDMVGGVDTSSLGSDIFAHPGQYTGAQKAAAMLQLSDAQSKLATGNKEGDWSGGTAKHDGLNSDEGKVSADLQQKITTLSQDPDVQSFFAQNRPAALQTLANADPGVHAQMQAFNRNEVQLGRGLDTELNKTDDKGKPVSAGAALQSWEKQAAISDAAMGQGGRPAGQLANLPQYVRNSGQEGRLQQAFQSDILSGHALKTDVAGGTDLASAIQDFNGQTAAFTAGLDPAYVHAHAGQLQSAYANTVSDTVLDSATQKDLNTAFADANGNLDAGKLNAMLDQARAQDPTLFQDAQGKPIPADKIVNAFRQTFDTVRQGAKLADALPKLAKAFPDANVPTIKPNQPIQDAYGKGVLHGVSALFAGGVLAAKIGEGGGTPTADASIAGTAAQFMGQVMEGGSKYASSLNKAAGDGAKPVPLAADTLKGIESGGKALGAVGGAIGGGLSLFSGINELKSGETVPGALDLAAGITGSASAIASGVEGGLGIASAAGVAGLDGALAVAGAAAAPLGIAAAGVGVLALVGLGIYDLVKKHQQQERSDAFMGQLDPTLKQYGIGTS